MEAWQDATTRYRGLPLAVRLQYASTVLPPDAAQQALGAALQEIKATTQATDLYRRLAALPGGKLHPA